MSTTRLGQAGIGVKAYGTFLPKIAADEEVLDHRRYRRKYIVRRKDELFVFDNPFDAQAFENQNKPVQPVVAKGPKRTPKLVRAAETISIPAVVNAAPDWAKARLEKMIAEAQYARLLDMVAELEEEDELELILLNL